MRHMNAAVGILACLLAACAEPTSTPLTPTGPRNVQSKPAPTLTVSSPGNCVTSVDWVGSGVEVVVHEVEVDGAGRSLAAPDSVDKHLDFGSSTAQWNPGSFYQSGARVPTGRIRAALQGHKGKVLASTDWVDAGFDCTAN